MSMLAVLSSPRLLSTWPTLGVGDVPCPEGPEGDSSGDDDEYGWRRRYMRVQFAKVIPSRILSRVWGLVSGIPIPLLARHAVLGSWAWILGVDTDELDKPLSEFRSLQEFFTRRLKEGARPLPDVDEPHVVACPVDGRVVCVSDDMAGDGWLEQVKGVRYHVEDFLGQKPPEALPGNAIFSIVIHLAPCDYHHFHSPVDWMVHSRTHIAGQLLPVHPLAVKLVPTLFCANERVALFGRWRYGFFSYTAVGATNVGSIRLRFDSTVRTNTWGGSLRRVLDTREYERPLEAHKYLRLGHFELGSTIVLVFEAPASFKYSVRPGEKVWLGTEIGSVDA